MRFRNIISHVRVSQNLHFLLGNYTYAPLPTSTSIRLLELVPSPDRRVVQCSLKPFELQDAPPFQAVSYTWGNSQLPISKSSASSKIERSQLNSARPSSTQKDARNPALERDPENAGRSRRHSIICDGRIIKVTSNLRDALRMLVSTIASPKLPVAPRYYWIDALCMDQQNVAERYVLGCR